MIPIGLSPARNLADLADKGAARANLGLGPLAVAANPAGVAGTYTNPTITVDTTGRVVGASSGSSGGGGGGSSGPTDQLKLAATHGTPFLFVVGTDSSNDNGGSGNTDATGGPAYYTTYNGTGNRQVCLFDSAQFGSAYAAGFRYIVGLQLPVIDAIRGDLQDYKNFLVGGPGSCVGMGLDAGSAQSDIKGQLHVRAGVAGRPGLYIQPNGANAATVADSSGNVLGGIGPRAEYAFAALADSVAAPGSAYFGTDHPDGVGAPKLCRKDAAGNVTVIG